MNWFIGFTMGVLLAAGYNRIADINAEKKRLEEDVAAFGVGEVLSAYKEGRRDALKTNPVSPLNWSRHVWKSGQTNNRKVETMQRCTQRFHWKPPILQEVP
jgi:hypothetical protein